MTVLDFRPSAVAPAASAAPPPDEALTSRYRPIFERIAGDAVRREQTRDLPYEPVQWLKDAGFGALRVPQAHGGSGATLVQLFRLLVELGEADSNLVQILRAHFAFVEERLNSEDRRSQEIWFRRIAAGALAGAAMAERNDATKNTVTLTRDGDGWLLNGQKFYCTGTLYADWIHTAAMDGEERVGVIVPTNAPGVTRIDDWDGFGQRLTGSGTTKFENVRLADEHIVRRFAVDEYRTDSYITAFYQLFHVAALAGIARAVLRDGVAFVQGRTRAFGIPGVSCPRTDPLVQRVVGRLSSLAFTAECLAEGVATALDEAYRAARAGNPKKELYVAADIKAFQAQQIVIGLTLEATSLLFEVGGASATSESRRLDRHWRNARTIASHNPAIYREQALGGYYLNGTVPSEAWAALHRKARAEGVPSAAPDDGDASGAVAAAGATAETDAVAASGAIAEAGAVAAFGATAETGAVASADLAAGPDVATAPAHPAAAAIVADEAAGGRG